MRGSGTDRLLPSTAKKPATNTQKQHSHPPLPRECQFSVCIPTDYSHCTCMLTASYTFCREIYILHACNLTSYVRLNSSLDWVLYAPPASPQTGTGPLGDCRHPELFPLHIRREHPMFLRHYNAFAHADSSYKRLHVKKRIFFRCRAGLVLHNITWELGLQHLPCRVSSAPRFCEPDSTKSYGTASVYAHEAYDRTAQLSPMCWIKCLTTCQSKLS